MEKATVLELLQKARAVRSEFEIFNKNLKQLFHFIMIIEIKEKMRTPPTASFELARHF